MRTWYDLNADVAEGFPYDAELMQVVTQANVACGFHAGDAAMMREVCRLAVKHGVDVGAQVSYRDREHFGRRDLDVDSETLRADLDEQVATLTAIAAEVGTGVGYLKPHGALYNRVVWDEQQAAVVADVCRRASLPLLCLPGSVALRLASDAGVACRREFFADRAYDARGQLVPRTVAGAVVDDPAQVTARVRRFVDDGSVITIDGSPLDVEADSICVHGDTPGALALARSVRTVLDESRPHP